jgi:hypothetical protein
MSEEPKHPDPRSRAEKLVHDNISHDAPISPADVGNLVNALTDDFRAESQRATDDEERLAKIETQTRVLAEAVIAITAVDVAVAPAIQAVKDEM